MVSRKCEVLSRGRLGAVRLRVSSYAPRWSVPEHAHRRDQLCLLLDEHYEAVWGEERFLCRAGDAVFHPAGVRHADRLLAKRCHSLRLEWEPGRTPEELGRGGPFLVRTDRVATLGRWIAEEVRTGIASESVLARLLSLFELEVERAHRGTQRAPRREEPAPEWLFEARAFVESRFRAGVGLKETALHVGRPPGRVAERFRRCFGASVGELVRELRVAHAEKLMRESRAGLTDIALAAGFCDQAHLTRVFGKLRGVTPAAWRCDQRAR